MKRVSPGRLAVVCLLALAFLSSSMFCSSAFGQDANTDVGPATQQLLLPSSATATHVGNGPYAPRARTDSRFVADQGGFLDQYLYRYNPSLTNHRLSFDILIDRYYSTLINSKSVDANTGQLNSSTARDLIQKKLLPETATLVLLIYDVDHENSFCPEVDYLFVNGTQVLDSRGNKATLTSGDSRWSTWSISIPIQMLRFPTSPGANWSRPQAQANRIEIEIDAGDCGQGQDNWAVEVDWGAIEIASPVKPFVLVHGWTGNQGTFSETNEGFYNLLAEYGVPVAPPLNYDDGIEPASETAKLLRREIQQQSTQYGVDQVNVVGHSKGGLFARQAVRTDETTRRMVENMVTLATPNHGVNPAEEGGGMALCMWKYRSDQAKRDKCIAAVADMDEAALRRINYSSTCRQNWEGLKPWEWIGCVASYTEYLNRAKLTPDDPVEPNYYSFVGDILGVGDTAVTKRSATYPWNADQAPMPSVDNVNRVFSNTDHGKIKQDRAIFQCVLSFVDSRLYSRSACPATLLSMEEIQAAGPAVVAGAASLLSEEFALSAGATHASTVLVAETAVTFRASSGQPLTFHLVDPTGRVIDPAVADSDPAIVYVAGTANGVWTYEYQVSSAPAGAWQLIIVSATDSYVSVAVEAQSTTALLIGASKAVYQPNETVVLYAALVDSNRVLAGAAVMGSIQYAGNAASVAFRDDGTNGDTAAGDGVYTARFAAPNFRGQVTAKADAKTAVRQRTAQTSFLVAQKTATLQQVSDEFTSDPNNNGLFDSVTFNVVVDVNTVGDFVVKGQLVDKNQQPLAWATYSAPEANQGNLPPGQYVFPLTFDGSTIREHGVDGPYTLRRLTLHDEKAGDFEIDLAQDIYTSAAYPVNTFEAAALNIAGGSDQALDLNSNGKLDTLRLAINFGVLFPGNYDWNARLVDGDEVEVGWYVGSGYLDSQTPMVFEFDGTRIARNAENGPYFLRDLSVYQISGGTTAVTFERVYTTAAYQYLDFEGALPKADFGVGTLEVIEHEGQVAVPVTLNVALPEPIALAYVVEDGTAQAGKDYTAADGFVTIPAGQTTAQIFFDVHKDSLAEGSETFFIRLSSAANVVLGRNNPLRVAIVDFGPPSTVSVNATPSTIAADGLSSSVVSALVRDMYGNPVANQMVNFATSLGTIGASAVTDANGNASVLLISAAQQGVAAITVKAGSATGGTQVTFQLPTLAFAQPAYAAEENAGASVLTVKLSNTSGAAVSAEYVVSRLSGEFVASGQVTFAPGATVKTISVPIKDDAIDEPSETMQVTMRNPRNAALGQPAAVTLTISDDDPAPTVQFIASTFEVLENAGHATVGVQISSPSAFAVSVECLIDGGRSKNLIVKQLAFPPGSTVQSFAIPIVDDMTAGPNSSMVLTLRNPVNATIGVAGRATLTIIDASMLKRLYMPQVSR